MAHVQTFEGQEGTSERKARFLIISGQSPTPARCPPRATNTNPRAWQLSETAA